MPPREPFLPGPVSTALARRALEAAAAGQLTLGPVLQIAFPTAGAPRQVAHGLGTVPDGFLVARATGAVYAVAWEAWTAAVADLQAPVANTIAEGCFFTWAIPVTPAIA